MSVWEDFGKVSWSEERGILGRGDVGFWWRQMEVAG